MDDVVGTSEMVGACHGAHGFCSDLTKSRPYGRRSGISDWDRIRSPTHSKQFRANSKMSHTHRAQAMKSGNLDVLASAKRQSLPLLIYQQ